jgi:hypothetical protein
MRGYRHILTEIYDAIGVIRLNRPRVDICVKIGICVKNRGEFQ